MHHSPNLLNVSVCANSLYGITYFISIHLLCPSGLQQWEIFKYLGYFISLFPALSAEVNHRDPGFSSSLRSLWNSVETVPHFFSAQPRSNCESEDSTRMNWYLLVISLKPKQSKKRLEISATTWPIWALWNLGRVLDQGFLRPAWGF